MSLKDKVKSIKSGKLTAAQNITDFVKKIKQVNDNLNIFLSVNEKAITDAHEIDKRIKEKKSVGKLAGLCFAVKANISVKGLGNSCASKVLEDYISAYDATVVEKLKDEDAIVLGIVNMDEFACGSSGETSAFGPVKNPRDLSLIPGGSSSGSAASVAAGLCDFALGSDTGGSIRNPASHCGIVGMKPTYGSVSRYGLIDLSMSLDQIGPLTQKVEDARLIFDIIKGQDNFDATTVESPARKSAGKSITVGLVDVQDFCDKRIAEIVSKRAEAVAEKNGWKIKRINLPLEIAIPAYYLLVYVEFFSGTRKFDGRRYGQKIEEAAGPEVIRRILGGSEISKAEHHGKYYREALKAMHFVRQQFGKLFEDVDVVILPTVPKLPHKIGEQISIEDMYAYDVLTVPMNLAGVCAISVPCGKIDGKPVGIQISAPRFAEDLLFAAAGKFE